MHLHNTNGESFELIIAGYEYPILNGAGKPNKYDPNWLNITVHVQHKVTSWTTTAPCMLTWEVQELIDWLAAISQCMPFREARDFIEPNLIFSLTKIIPPTIRITIGHTLHPDWTPDNHCIKAALDFAVTPAIIETAIASLQTQLAQYPRRATGSATPKSRSKKNDV